MTQKLTAWLVSRRRRFADLFEKIGAGAFLLGAFGGNAAALVSAFIITALCLLLTEKQED
ncbi:MAG: hypothetical protein LBP75_03090 [Planctomycetota bacterium]|jgi:hypothetical protein|nr:hypothetical protein [Planctomycetota bacterium]